MRWCNWCNVATFPQLVKGEATLGFPQTSIFPPTAYTEKVVCIWTFWCKFAMTILPNRCIWELTRPCSSVLDHPRERYHFVSCHWGLLLSVPVFGKAGGRRGSNVSLKHEFEVKALSVKTDLITYWLPDLLWACFVIHKIESMTSVTLVATGVHKNTINMYKEQIYSLAFFSC